MEGKSAGQSKKRARQSQKGREGGGQRQTSAEQRQRDLGQWQKKGVGGLLNMRGGTTKRVGISGKKDRKGAGDSRKSVKLFN